MSLTRVTNVVKSYDQGLGPNLTCYISSMLHDWSLLVGVTRNRSTFTKNFLGRCSGIFVEVMPELKSSKLGGQAQ